MSQKTKAIILIVIILLATIGAALYYFKKSTPVALAPQIVNEFQDSTIEPGKEAKKMNVEGKVRSINEKQVYIELADGNGFAININAATPVRTEGIDKVGNLSSLKIDMTVSVKVNAENDALEILIRR